MVPDSSSPPGLALVFQLHLITTKAQRENYWISAVLSDRGHENGPVSVSTGCHNKIPWARQLQHQEFIFSQPLELMLTWSGFGEGSLPGLQSHLLTVFSDGRKRDRKRRAQTCVSSYKGTNPMMRVPPSSEPSGLLRTHIRILAF